MLFVYETPQPVAFWMKNTLIPLDMLFFDAEGRLTPDQEPGAAARRDAGRRAATACSYVLEINGGLAESLGIDLGAELRHPAVAGAAWSCGE